MSVVSYKPLSDYTFVQTNDYVISFKGKGELHAYLGKVVAKAEGKFVVMFADGATKVVEPSLVWRLSHISVFPDEYETKEDVIFYLNPGVAVLLSFVKGKKVD